ncbi:uncharacterized protein EI90DRAFT_3030036 [Cantharellus anzutake]|uniref:uncharacterized protein n=1 Tax=Cantharellus anzutake TaxID=1750568 RepID=UPI0019074244|nr:uncharacterized protein EI90DRAFT_3030036 [Cantharellus anzutake]KAF8342736.1 hypothetical protein EI90DRAFT_3030036 [Cantharellus anzutake]
MGPAITIRTAASVQNKPDQAPLLPSHVHHTYGLKSPPVRLPAIPARSYGSVSEDESGETQEATHHTSRTGTDSRLPSLPKLSRECLISETKCYGRYILACLIVFALGGVLLASYLSAILSKGH